MATISDRIEIPAPQAGEGYFSNKNQHLENHDTGGLNGDSGACSGHSAGQSAGYLADGRRTHFYQLRRDVARLEGYIDSPRLALGVDVLDSALAGGLALGRAHMLCGRPGHDAALTGFAAALVRRLMTRKDGPVVWCPAAAMGGTGMLYAAGFSALGIDPSRLLIVDAPSPTRRLAALEDILRTEGLAAVVVEYDGLNQSSDYWMRLARRASLLPRPAAPPAFCLAGRWRQVGLTACGMLRQGGGRRRMRCHPRPCRRPPPGIRSGISALRMRVADVPARPACCGTVLPTGSSPASLPI